MKENKYTGFQNLIDRVLKKDIKLEYIHGYLTAVLCAPELILPSTWVPFITQKGGEAPEYESAEEAEKLMGALLDLYNEISGSINDGSFYPLYSISKKKITPGIAKTWCKGFILGLNLWEDSIAGDDKAGKYIVPISFLSNTEAVKKVIKESGKSNYSDEEFERLKENSLDEIPGNVIALRRYFQPGLKKSYGKTGRNEPCPCGSGKKYKKCCGAH